MLDPSFMDGPSVKWTVADICKPYPRLFMVYHVIGTPYDVFTPVGTVLGGLLYTVGVVRPFPSALAMMGTSGLVAGCSGALLGCAGLAKAAWLGEAASPTPWNKDGIQQRVDGLSHNFTVRNLDKSVWLGIGLATGCLISAGGPQRLGLSASTLGVFQALSLGSAVGSVGAFAYIAWTKRAEKNVRSSDDS